MKQLFLLFICLSFFSYSYAQPVSIEHKPYEKTATIRLFGLSTEAFVYKIKVALSDWEGSGALSKDNIDMIDSKHGAIIYKGKLYLMRLDASKYGSSYPKDDEIIYANYTLKMKAGARGCDILVSVPYLSTASGNRVNRIIPIDMVIPNYSYKTNNTILDLDIISSAKKVESSVDTMIHFLDSRINNIVAF